VNVTETLTLTSVLLAMAMVVPAARETLRTDPAGFRKTLKLAGLYLLYVAVAILLTLWMLSGPQPALKGLAVFAFLLAWIFYGVLWLTRLVPRYRAIPAWIDKRPSALDCFFLAIILGSLGYSLIA
jgi:hypothetical protein